ncbi:MAG: dTMP kinase [Acidobacteriota bacterium]|nr:dTMP kinase [Acidobacteriota bacterium]
MAGTFITFEGIDGCGKSTQLRLLGNFLRSQGGDVLVTREPGGTSVGLRLRAALLDAQEQVDPLTELLVFAADRAQHVRRVLRPALAAGRIVLSDRYADATRAYQGGGRGFPVELISEIVQLATEGLIPDLTLLFDLSVNESSARTRRRAEGKQTGDRLDSEDAEFYIRVRETYLSLAEQEPERFRVLTTNGSLEETHKRVKEIVVSFLEARGQIVSRQPASAEFRQAKPL